MSKKKRPTVGEFRQQAALVSSDTKILVVMRTKDGELIYHTTSCFPDTTDEHGKHNTGGAFKIVIEEHDFVSNETASADLHPDREEG